MLVQIRVVFRFRGRQRGLLLPSRGKGKEKKQRQRKERAQKGKKWPIGGMKRRKWKIALKIQEKGSHFNIILPLPHIFTIGAISILKNGLMVSYSLNMPLLHCYRCSKLGLCISRLKLLVYKLAILSNYIKRQKSDLSSFAHKELKIFITY